MRRIITGDATNTAPLSPQCTVEKEAEEWGKLWAAQERLPPLSWPTELGPMPPRPSVQKLRAALATFPPDTGLSWDALHPRALRRLSDARLERLIDLLMMAERRGQWPATMGMVTVVLLPKPEGGFRPIGLFPVMIRAWMRLRRDAIQEWELANARAYFYSGPGRGAHIAAWKQASRAEMAACAKASYGQLLLDLEKCFELVDHAALVREAVAMNYPLPLLRLSLAACRMPRALSINGAYSSLIDPMRGYYSGIWHRDHGAQTVVDPSS